MPLDPRVLDLVLGEAARQAGGADGYLTDAELVHLERVARAIADETDLGQLLDEVSQGEREGSE